MVLQAGSGLWSKSLLENRLGAVVPGVPRRRLVRGFGRLAETLRAITWNVSARTRCLPAMRAHLDRVWPDPTLNPSL